MGARLVSGRDQCLRPGLGSGGTVVADVEVVDVDLLQEQQGTCLDEGRERALHLEVGHHMLEFAVEATKKGENELSVADRIAEVIEAAIVSRRR